MPNVKELYDYLDKKIPRALSCEWDNDGLMVCADADKSVRRVLLALDATDAVAEYAKEKGFPKVIIHTTEDNLPAQALYRKAGYALIEVGPCTTADGAERVGYTFEKCL